MLRARDRRRFRLAGSLHRHNLATRSWTSLQSARSTPTFEELHGTLVPFGGFTRLERAQIAAAAGFRVDFAAVKSVLSASELPDHDALQA